jgi:hypothetical protein
MKPIKTKNSNFVYKGPQPDIGDAWVERRPQEQAVFIVWEPNDDERRRIGMGANIELGIYYMEPIPPVSLNTTPLVKVEESPFKILTPEREAKTFA